MQLHLLGTKGGPAIRTGGPSPTAHLLVVGSKTYVIDCGLGVTRGLVETGMKLQDLETILITHHHSDHTLEWGPLIHTAWTAGLARPVMTYAPPPMHQLKAGFLAAMDFDIRTRIADEGRPDLAGLMGITEYGPGLVFDDGVVRVSALRNVHPPITQSYALRFEAAGRVVVFSGDTAFLPELADFARDADVLVHEAMYGPGVDALVQRVKNGTRLKEHLLASHTLAEDVGRIATLSGARHLVLNHLVPADDPSVTAADYERAVRTTFGGALTVGRDGLIIDIVSS